MKEERILAALGSIRDEYIVEAAPSPGKAARRSIRWIAAVLALVLGAAFFTQTAPGAAAAAFVREQAASLMETLFPPKDVVATPEGTPEKDAFIAGGQAPRQDASAATPGFAIYYDPDSYRMTQENGMTYIRGIPAVPTRQEIRENHAALLEGLTAEDAQQKLSELLAQQEALYASLPRCELEILHVPNTASDETARAVRAEKQQQWESVSEIEACALPEGVTFRASSGTAWDAPAEELYFTGDGQTGTYQMTVRYFVEAAEGQGARLTAMVRTFAVIPPQ